MITRIFSSVLLSYTLFWAPGAAAVAPPLAFRAAVGSEKPVGSVTPRLQSELSLRGSRGETLNFSFQLPLGSCSEYALSPWTPGKPPRNTPVVRFYEMETLDITHQSFPHAAQGELFDPLLPVRGKKLCPTGHGNWFWGELEIPDYMAPGKYEARLRVGKESLPIHLTVWKMTMPETPTLPAYMELSSWYLLLGHYGAWHAGEEILSEKYALEMKRHRIFPVKSFIAKPEIATHGDRPTLDLTNKPTKTQSFTNVTLKHRPKDVFFDFPTIMPPDIAKPETVTYFKAIENSLTSLHRPGKAMVYLWDEPKPEEMPALLRLAKVVRAQAPDLKILVTNTPTAELNPFVDIYVPVMDQFDGRGFPDLAAYRKLQAQGKQVWWYVSCMSHGCDALMDSGRPDMVIERPSAWIRSIGWLSRRFGLDAFLYYAVVNGYEKSPKRDPWKDLWDFSGNGDGTLFYPGRPGEHGFTEHAPVPSIRLKAWRESSFDADYVQWMEHAKTKPTWWDSEFKALTQSTTAWDHDYDHYQALRDKVGEYLNAH